MTLSASLERVGPADHNHTLGRAGKGSSCRVALASGWSGLEGTDTGRASPGLDEPDHTSGSE
jgi:hypothetical protein